MSSYTTRPIAVDDTLYEVLNLASDGVLVYEALRDERGEVYDYMLIGLNETATAIFGKGREELQGKHITEIWPGIRHDYMWNIVEGVLASQEPFRAEIYRTTPSGHTRWYDISLRPYKDGFANSYRDITAAKEALAQTEKQKKFYEDLLMQSMSRKAVYRPVFNSDDTIDNFLYEYANYGKGIDDSHRHLPMFDMELEGKYLTDVLPSVKSSVLWPFLCSAAVTEAESRTEFHYDLDGIDAFIDISVKPLKGGSVLIAYSDVSASHRLARQLDTEKSQLNAIVENIPLGLTVFEGVRNEQDELVDLRLALRNEKAMALSRIPDEKYIPGALISELMPRELQEQMEVILDVVRTGRSAAHELYQPHIDSWILSRMVKHEDGVISTIQDITEIKRNAQRIQEQAQLLEGVLQSSPHAILVFEAIRDAEGNVEDFRIVRFNQRAAITTAIPGDKLAQTTLFTCMPSVRARLPQYVAVIESGNPETYEFYNEKLGLWRRIINTPLGDGFVMTMEDITEQKAAANKLEETAGLLNAVLDASPISIVLYESIRNEAGEILDFNPIIANREGIKLSGFTQEEFLTRTFFQRAPSMKEGLLPVLSDVVATRVPLRTEYQVPSSGVWVNAVATAFGDGFIATSTDISTSKQQSRIIQEQAELFDGVLKSLQNGLTVFEIIRNKGGEFIDLRYLEVADATLEEMHMPREKVIGNTIRTLYPGIEETDYWTAYARVVKTGEPQHFETYFTLQEYNNHLLNWVSPIGSDKIVSVFYNINDLKRAQSELEHTIHELKRSNDDLEQFASVASHDLQEPLRKLQSFGNMLEQRYADKLDDSGKNLLQRMQHAAGRMRDLVTGLLSFARLSGHSDEKLEPVDLYALISAIVGDLDELLATSGAEITIKGQLPAVLGLEGQLRHLFSNLLSNAIKFRKADAAPEIEIRAGKALPEDQKYLSPLSDIDQYIRVDVSDNGIGFEPEYAERIFGLFERLHGNAEYHGTGIGLSICRRVAERHNGAIAAKSQLGQGSTFTVWLIADPNH